MMGLEIPLALNLWGGSRYLDAVLPSNGSSAPGTAAAYADLVGGIYNSTPITLTNGQQASLQLTSAGLLEVAATLSYDTNYGVVGANTLRTASEIGNSTGAADFNFGGASAQTLRVAALLGNAAGVIDYNYGAASAQTIRTASEIGNATGAASFNYGAVGAQTLRVASQIGNATGAADFNTGATGAQTLRVAANLYDNTGTPFSTTNPLPVTIEAAPGTHINDFKDASAIAAGGTDNHDYTVTAGKTFYFNQAESAASGKSKMIVQIETGVGTGIFNARFTQFNSTANPNMSIPISNSIAVAAGVRVRLAMSNRDLQPEDLYSTICGYEV